MDTDKLFHVDWETVLTPSSSLLEMFVRGTLTYWFCFLYLRIFRRGTTQTSVTDLLLITLIADAAQNSMANDYKSVLEGIVLVGTLVGWNFVLDWLGYQTEVFRWLTNPTPVLLVANGKLQRQNLKREFITEDELLQRLREQGVDDISKVKSCHIEGSGNISVIEKK